MLYSGEITKEYLVKIYSIDCSALAIVYLVGRYKQCFDFSVTVHLYHFLACWIYNSQLANVFYWYLIQFLSIVIMTILSEHLSKRLELQNIPLTTRVDL